MDLCFERNMQFLNAERNVQLVNAERNMQLLNAEREAQDTQDAQEVLDVLNGERRKALAAVPKRVLARQRKPSCKKSKSKSRCSLITIVRREVWLRSTDTSGSLISALLHVDNIHADNSPSCAAFARRRLHPSRFGSWLRPESDTAHGSLAHRILAAYRREDS